MLVSMLSPMIHRAGTVGAEICSSLSEPSL